MDFNLAQRRATPFSGATIAGICNRIAEWGIYAIAVLVPLIFMRGMTNGYTLPKVTSLRLLTLLVLAAFLISALSSGRFRWVRTPLDIPILAYLGINLIATFFSVSVYVSVFGLYRRGDGLITLFNLAILYFLAVNVLDTEAKIRRAVVLTALAGMVEGLIAIGQYFDIPGIGLGFIGFNAGAWFGGRPYGTSGNPDFLGNYLAMIVPIAVGLLLLGRNRAHRLLWSVAVAVCSIALFLTGTRAGWLAFLVVLLVGFPLLWRQLLSRARWVAGIALVVALVAVATETGWYLEVQRAVFGSSSASVSEESPAVPTGDLASATAVVGEETQVSPQPEARRRGESALNRVLGAIESGGAGRLELWQSAAAAIAERPILGTGPSTVPTSIVKYLALKWTRLRPALWPDKAHNEFLDVAAQTGLLGLGAYLFLLVSFATATWKFVRTEANDTRRIVVLALLLAWLAYLVHSFFLFGMVDTWTIFWLVLAFVVGFLLLDRREQVVWALRFPSLGRGVAAVAIMVVVALPIAPSVDAIRADQYLSVSTEASHEQSDPQRNADALRRAMELNQRDNAVLVEAGRGLIVAAYWARDRQEQRLLLEEAVRAYSQAIQRDRLNPGLYYERGVAYEAFGDDHQSDALADYTNATRLYPDFVYALERQTNLAQKLGLLREAVIAERQLVKIFPHRLDVLLSLGSDYLSLGRVDEAITTWKRALILDSNDPMLHLRLGNGYEAKNDLEAARTEYETALSLEPTFHLASDALKALNQKIEKREQESR